MLRPNSFIGKFRSMKFLFKDNSPPRYRLKRLNMRFHSHTLSKCARFEVFAVVTMKNVVFWDIKPQFVLHRRHSTSPTTELSQLMLYKIWRFHGGDYEEWRLLGCYAVWLLYEPTFRRNLAPASSGLQESMELGTTLAVSSNRHTLRRNTNNVSSN
jgi:hypothetical protein